MKITVISGSTRNDSQSRRVSDYFAGRLKTMSIDSPVLDLNQGRLPFYDDTGEGDWKSMWEDMRATLGESDGFVTNQRVRSDFLDERLDLVQIR